MSFPRVRPSKVDASVMKKYAPGKSELQRLAGRNRLVHSRFESTALVDATIVVKNMLVSLRSL